MEISQKLLCFLFLASFTVGWVAGIAYDALFLIRLFFYDPSQEKQRSWSRRLYLSVTFLMDFSFALSCGVLLILLLYFLNDGVFRFLAPLGIGCGIFAYRVTLGRLVQKISEALVHFIRRLSGLAFRAIWKPIRACLGLLYAFAFKPIIRMMKSGYDRQMIKRTRRMVERFIQDASQVFSEKK